MRIHTSSRRGKKHAHFLLSALTNVLILGRLLRLQLCFVPCAKPHRLGAVRTTTTCHHILYRCRWSCGQNSWHGGWSFPQPFPSWIKHLKEGSCLGTVVDQAILKDQDVAVDVCFGKQKLEKLNWEPFSQNPNCPWLGHYGHFSSAIYATKFATGGASCTVVAHGGVVAAFVAELWTWNRRRGLFSTWSENSTKGRTNPLNTGNFQVGFSQLTPQQMAQVDVTRSHPRKS